MDSTVEFSWLVVKQFTDQLLFEATGKHMSDIELSVLQGAWEGKSYGEIAEMHGYTLEYINCDVGFNLWNKLSQALGEKVTKRNFRGALERAWLKENKRNQQIYPAPNSAGAVPQAKAQYIERPPTEARCFEAIRQPGALIRIKAPQKMGKTWLVDHILRFAQQQNYLTVPINLLRFEAAIFQDLNRFLKTFSNQVTRQLSLDNKLDQYWDDGLGSNTSCTEYFEEYILQSGDRPIVLALDNVDRLFPFEDVAANFFSLLRAWYEDARILEDWQKLRLIIAHSTEVYPSLNINRSPFNVGVAVELTEFSAQQIEDLARCQGLERLFQASSTGLVALTELVGGHPYLLQRAFDYLRTQPQLPLGTVIESAPTEAGLYAQHLRNLFAGLQNNPELAVAMKTVVQQSAPVRIKPKHGFMLHSLGLVKLRGNEVEVSCPLYQLYFGDRLEDL